MKAFIIDRYNPAKGAASPMWQIRAADGQLGADRCGRGELARLQDPQRRVQGASCRTGRRSSWQRRRRRGCSVDRVRGSTSATRCTPAPTRPRSARSQSSSRSTKPTSHPSRAHCLWRKRSIPLVGLTAWQALVERANLQPGQKVFIQAGSAAWARSPSSWRSISERRWPRPPAPPTSTSSSASAPTSSSTTGPRTSRLLDDYDVVLHSQDGPTLDKSLRS